MNKSLFKLKFPIMENIYISFYYFSFFCIILLGPEKKPTAVGRQTVRTVASPLSDDI